MRTFAIIIIILAISACTNYEFDQSGVVSHIENEDSETIAQYSYRNNGSLKSSKEYSVYYFEDAYEEFEYTFNDEGQLIEKEGFVPGNLVMSNIIGASDKKETASFSYFQNGKIKETISTINVLTELDANLDYTTTTTYTYDSNIVNETITMTTEYDTIISYNEYIFNDDGNISEIKHYNGTKILYGYEKFTYDNMKKPYSFTDTPQSKNNVLTKDYYSCRYSDGEITSDEIITSYTYSYEYNESGYPTKSIETYPNKYENIKFYYYN